MISVLRELYPMVSVEVLVHGVTLDLTCKLLGLHTLARLPVPRWNAVDHHRGGRFWQAHRLAMMNKRSAISDQRRAGVIKNGSQQLY